MLCLKESNSLGLLKLSLNVCHDSFLLYIDKTYKSINEHRMSLVVMTHKDNFLQSLYNARTLISAQSARHETASWHKGQLLQNCGKGLPGPFYKS